MRRWINLMEAAALDPALHAEYQKLNDSESAALEAYNAQKTREALERIWQIRKRRDELQQLLWPVAPPASEIAADDYHGQHKAPTSDGGAPLHDVSEMFGPDFYTGHAYEHAYDEVSRNCISLMLSYHDRPNAPIKIYRSVPKGLPRKINKGDWVSISRRYAVEHGQAHLKGDYVVLSKTAFARDVFTDANSPAEWGYDPQPRVTRAKST